VLQGQDALLEQKLPGEDFDCRASLEQSTEGFAAWCDLVHSQVESSTFSGSHGTGAHRRQWDHSLHHLASEMFRGWGEGS